MRIILFIATLAVIIGAYFLFTVNDSNDLAVELDSVTYYAPGLSSQTPSQSGTIVSRLTSGNPTLEGDSFESVSVPRWIVREFYGRGTLDVRLMTISVIPSDTLFKFAEQEPIGSDNDFNLYIERNLAITNAPEEVVAERRLESRPDLTLKIAVPYKDEPNQKFRNVEDASEFISVVLETLESDSEILSVVADNFSTLESNTFGILGNVDSEDVEAFKEWPDVALTAIFYGQLPTQLQFTPLTEIAQSTFEERGTVEAFCDSLYTSQNEVDKVIPDSFSCFSGEKDILLLLEIDENINFCADSSGFSGLIKTELVNTSNLRCIQG
jgi:hypothetical protein